MKPKNFPGRKNDRRIVALARLRDRLAIAPPAPWGATIIDRLQKEIDTLEDRIVDDDTARQVRTKKDRSAQGRG